MTVSSSTAKVSYSGNGATQAFAVPFYFLANSQLLVVRRSSTGVDVTQVLGTDYTVTGAGVLTGGTVTMTVAPPVGTTLVISRNVPLTQETDLQPNDRLPAETLEQSIDKLTMITQQLDETTDRALKYPLTDSGLISSTLPSSTQRANKYLAFDSVGAPITLTSLDQDVINVQNFGVVGDGITDDRAALLLAKAAAISSGKALYAPAGLTVRLGSSTDLTGVKSIEFQADILIPSGTLTIGGFFNSGNGQLNFRSVTNGNNTLAAPPASPVLRITGLSNSFVRVFSCNYIQLYADSAVSNNRAVAYNIIELLGVVTLLELTDSGAISSYVNENFIYADRLIKYKIIGVGYPHNHNKLFHPCMEGDLAEIVFNKAWTNQVYGARFEGVILSPAITFDSETVSNTVMSTWSGTGNPDAQFQMPVIVSDSGEGNMVTSEAATQFNKTPVLSVNANSMIVATATSSNAPDRRISPSVAGLTTLPTSVINPSLAGFSTATSEIIAVSDPIPVKLGDVIYWDGDYSGDLIRPIVWVLDEDQKPLISEGSGGPFYSQPNMTVFDTTYGLYTAGTGLALQFLFPGAVIRSEVKYVRVGVFQSDPGLIKSISASIYTQALLRSPTEDAARTSFSLPVLDGTPTRGFVPINFTIWDKTARELKLVTYQFETQTDGALTAGNTSVTVDDAGAIANGDLCGILLDDLTTHWTTVSGLSSATFTIAAIPSGKAAASGNRVVFNRWTSNGYIQYQKTPILSVSQNSMIVGTSTSSSSPDKRIGASVNGLTSVTSAVITPSLAGFSAPTSEVIAFSDPIPVTLGDTVLWEGDFSGSILRPIVWVLDANQKPLVSEGGGGAYWSQINLSTYDTTYGLYTAGTGLSSADLLPGTVARSEVKFIRVGFLQSTAGLIKSVNVSLYTVQLNRGASEGPARTLFSLPVVDGTPTRGYVTTNFAVWDSGASAIKRVTYQFETTTDGALAAGATSVTVNDAGSIANGDVCGILLDDLTTHWTSVSSLSSATFTIAAIPAGKAAASGNRIVFNRWA
jgi:hypothetical protein